MAAFQNGTLHIKKKTSVANADAGWIRIYVGSDGNVYNRDENGTVDRLIEASEVTVISGGLNTRLTTVENNYATKTSPTSGTYNNVIVNSQGVVTSGGNLAYALTSSIPTSATFLNDYDNRYGIITGSNIWTGSNSWTSQSLSLTNNGNSNTYFQVNNSNNGTNAWAGFIANENGKTLTTSVFSLGYTGTLDTVTLANKGMVYGAGTDGLVLGTSDGDISFYTTDYVVAKMVGGLAVGGLRLNYTGADSFVTSGSGKFAGNLTVQSIAGTNGNIVTHDANGRLLDSGVHISSVGVSGSGTVLSTGITDSTSAGRAMLTATSASGQWNLLESSAITALTGKLNTYGTLGMSRDLVTPTVSLNVAAQTTIFTPNSGEEWIVTNGQFYIDSWSGTASLAAIASLVVGPTGSPTMVLGNQSLEVQFATTYTPPRYINLSPQFGTVSYPTITNTNALRLRVSQAMATATGSIRATCQLVRIK
jgi:hypothetical protein